MDAGNEIQKLNLVTDLVPVLQKVLFVGPKKSGRQCPKKKQSVLLFGVSVRLMPGVYQHLELKRIMVDFWIG